MKKIQITHRPARLLWIIPIITVASYFEDKTLGLLFCFVLSFSTFRIFPLTEMVEVEEDTKDGQD